MRREALIERLRLAGISLLGGIVGGDAREVGVGDSDDTDGVVLAPSFLVSQKIVSISAIRSSSF